MSNHIDTIHQAYDAFRRGDIPAIIGMLTEDVIWIAEGVEILPWTGIMHGHEGALKFFAALAADLEGFELEMTEDLADDTRVFSLGRFTATVKKTGKRVSTPIAHFFRMRDGKICEFRDFFNTAAFAEAMLPETVSAKV
jgi:ketosteroid isomerase-like protein